MAFAPSKGKKNLRKEKGSLTLNSMMDMMTIILLFLLKSMSTSGALIRPSEYVDLPMADREMDPKKAVALLVSAEGVFKDTEGDPQALSLIDELEDPANPVLPGLESFLVERRDLALKVGQAFKGEVTIQCDKSIPYRWLLKVIATCGVTEFGTIDFVIIKKKA